MTEPTVTFPAEWHRWPDFDPNDHMMKIERFDKRANRKIVAAYLNVHNRLLWFLRDQRALIVAGLAKVPHVIKTDLVELDRERGWAHFRTYICDVLGNEATMYGSESAGDFPDYVEKASTKSLGRALLLLGYGTGMAPEMDEEDRVVDAPVAPQERTNQQNAATRPQARPAPRPPTPAPSAQPVAPQLKGVSLATDRQRTSIAKLCQSLRRPTPDLETMTFAAARDLLTQLSHDYSEARKAS